MKRLNKYKNFEKYIHFKLYFFHINIINIEIYK